MSNLSILQRNMLETMSEDAQVLYLRGCERDEWAACQMAWEWDRIDRTLTPALAAGLRVHGLGDDPGVREFIRERQYRRHFPQGRAAHASH